MKSYNRILLTLVAGLGLTTATAQAAYLFEIDTDGLDNGVISFHPGFSFGGDTTIASTSATATPFGATGGDSIFGGDGINQPDRYQYRYVPGADADNLFPSAGQDLGYGDLASGLIGGGAGTYAVYAAWPETNNVTGGLTRCEVSSTVDSFSVDIDQNGLGNGWVKLGEIDFVSEVIFVAQSPTGGNTFVSQRAYGLLFEPIPEPATLALMSVGGLVLLRRR